MCDSRADQEIMGKGLLYINPRSSIAGVDRLVLMARFSIGWDDAEWVLRAFRFEGWYMRTIPQYTIGQQGMFL